MQEATFPRLVGVPRYPGPPLTQPLELVSYFSCTDVLYVYEKTNTKMMRFHFLDKCQHPMYTLSCLCFLKMKVSDPEVLLAVGTGMVLELCPQVLVPVGMVMVSPESGVCIYRCSQKHVGVNVQGSALTLPKEKRGGTLVEWL